ncbi:MAG: heparinase II/III family protein [Ignavibacteriales bacterium]|nr:heparinase II/III family protein [Ignavibacteriales bacterium]
MKLITKIVLLLLLVHLVASLLCAQEKHLLGGAVSAEQLKKSIASTAAWHPFPKQSERGEWSRISEPLRKAYIAQAELYLNASWQTPKATDFLEYVRNGNRSRYQAISYGRREQLAALVLGECMEGKGRFLDDIMNGVWTICEETYWGVPAHVGLQKRGPGLPDVSEPTVDLFAAETGMLIAWTYYLVGDELARISPLVTERMRTEVQRRILSVNLARDDFWWMGFNATVNNWNPWICSNWLTAVLVFEDDPDRRAASVHKILRCLDNFLDPYPHDGGCDEGPAYWGRAGGSLFDCLELLQSASNNAINVFDKPLIKEIGRYIYRAYIHDEYFINFADAPAKQDADANLIFRYGKSIQDQTMMQFASYLARRQNLGASAQKGQFGSLGRILPVIFTANEMTGMEPREPLLRDFWLPELQVMGGRSSDKTVKGFYVAAQGGHNAESHNHNDVGNFIIYHDGGPVIIDVGVETYTAKTFGKDRYSLWTMQSAYHNLPTINGIMQKEGREYSASNVRYTSDDEKTLFRADIARAYPPEAKVKVWERSVQLNRGKDVVITDRYELEEMRQPVMVSLMTVCTPTDDKRGTVHLLPGSDQSNRRPISLSYDKDRFSVRIDTIPIEDPRLLSSWGNTIYRILLTAKGRALADEFSFRFREE